MYRYVCLLWIVRPHWWNAPLDLHSLVEGNLQCWIVVVRTRGNGSQWNVHTPRRILRSEKVRLSHLMTTISRHRLLSLISLVVSRILFGTSRIRPHSELE